MGSCFTKCIAFKNRYFKDKRNHIARYRESSSIIEFASLIEQDDEDAYHQSVVLPFEKYLVHAGMLDSLLEARFKEASDFSKEFRDEEELLELREEYFQDDFSESGSIEIISTKELLPSQNHESDSKYKLNEKDFEEFLERMKAKGLSSNRELPLMLNAGSLIKNDSSTTHSSIELDWESEGLTYPHEAAAANTDDDLPTTRTESLSIKSHHDSNSLSNDLEWDEDLFINQSTTNDDTEMLIDEIERLTFRALEETGPNR